MSFTLTDYQQRAVDAASKMTDPRPRLCLYYKTGAGKSLTALSCLQAWGHDSALVIAPPSTHDQWQKLGKKMNFDIECMSHAKFRMKSTLMSRTKAIVADEMHLFGGVKGAGWKKLERLGRTLDAPMVLASATPNYNDAERVYCIHRVLDPVATHGGYLEFLYKHCNTSQNMFGVTPIVTGFKEFNTAADYLSHIPGVEYLPDDTNFFINYPTVYLPPINEINIMNSFGYDTRRHRMVASIIERKHAKIRYQLLTNDDSLREQVLEEIQAISEKENKVLIFATHSTIAVAVAKALTNVELANVELVTGKSSTKEKTRIVNKFINDPDVKYLVGTASLATGTDGLDKVCNTLIIVDDTEDDSLRRQLMGRILPRGLDTDARGKQFYVFIYA